MLKTRSTGASDTLMLVLKTRSTGAGHTLGLVLVTRCTLSTFA